MRVLDLFSGIGGFSLGLERAGMRTVAFCECEPYCRAVLAKHWQDVPCYDDVRTLTAERLTADGVAVDVICGGFPCQDISYAGEGAGLAGERSGLWREFARVIGELRPSYVIVENVAALLTRGLGEVLGDLAALGFDAEWHCIPACAVGAPHRRDRIWIIAYPNSNSERCAKWPKPNGKAIKSKLKASRRRDPVRLRSDVSNSNRPRFSIVLGESTKTDASGRLIANSETWWPPEPGVRRLVDGLPEQVGELRAYGNAVIPQIPEIIGRAIMRQQFTDRGDQ